MCLCETNWDHLMCVILNSLIPLGIVSGAVLHVVKYFLLTVLMASLCFILLTAGRWSCFYGCDGYVLVCDSMTSPGSAPVQRNPGPFKALEKDCTWLCVRMCPFFFILPGYWVLLF